jgi:maltooligosyltrehalose trehalohydrolase
VVFSQNHDQVGNRLKSERLSQLVSFAALKLAAGAVLLSPYIPLLFMGEEYGEKAPFNYFISHLDEDLVRAVQKGRQEEFAKFNWQETPLDPQALETFDNSKLSWNIRQKENAVLFNFYKELIKIRKSLKTLSNLNEVEKKAESILNKDVFLLNRSVANEQSIWVMNFSSVDEELEIKLPAGEWHKILDAADEKWLGSGSSLPDTVSGNIKFKLSAYNLLLYKSER